MADDQGSSTTTDPTKSTATFLSALVLYTAIGIVATSAFLLCRVRNRNVYAPRTYMVDKDLREPTAPRSTGSFISYLFSKSTYPNSRLVERIGIDGVAFLRFLRLGMWLFAAFSVVGLAILAPVYAVNQGGLPGIGAITYGNVISTRRYWATLILSYVFVGCAIAAFVWELRRTLAMRNIYMRSTGHCAHPRSRTMLVRGIPANDQSTDRIIHAYASIAPVEHVHLFTNAINLEKAKTMRGKAALKLESAACTYIRTGKESISRAYPVFGKKREDIPFQLGKYQAATTEIANETAHMDNKERPSALITFTTQEGLWTAYKSGPPTDIKGLEQFPEVCIEDVYVPNVCVYGNVRRSKKTIAWTIVIALVIFWSLLTAFVGSITTLKNLIKLLPFLSPLENFSPVVVGIIQGILPTLAVAILMSLLPAILIRLCKLEGIPLVSEIFLSLQTKYFIFLIINVLLVVTISGGIFSSISYIVDHPDQTANLLASDFPKASTFFLDYVVLQGFMGPALLLLQIVPLIMKGIKRKYMAKTPRSLLKIKAMPIPNWGNILPPQALIFSIGMVYSTVQPLILPVTAISFGFLYLTYRYLLVFVLDVRPENSLRARGQLRMVSHCFAGIYLYELMNIGLFGVSQVWGQFGLEVALMVLTALANAAIQRKYGPSFRYVLPSEAGHPPALMEETVMEAKASTSHDSPGRVEVAATHQEFGQTLTDPTIQHVVWTGSDGHGRAAAIKERLEAENVPVETGGANWVRRGKKDLWVLEEELPERLNLKGDPYLRHDGRGAMASYDVEQMA